MDLPHKTFLCIRVINAILIYCEFYKHDHLKQPLPETNKNVIMTESFIAFINIFTNVCKTQSFLLFSVS